MIELIQGDCLDLIPKLSKKSIDCIVTSPPYNIGLSYDEYKDTIPREEYLGWTLKWLQAAKDVLKQDGSLFLNISGKPTNPWGPFEVGMVARELFSLQNVIYWVKSISIGEDSFGHYKPINSGRFLNDCTELIFHLTPCGNTSIDRLALGVPYVDKTNLKRDGRGKNGDLRCRGNAWFVPYETTTKAKDHPAAFPVKLVEMCYKLHGIKKNMKTLDPFSGSGSSAVASAQLGIDHIGFEISDKNIEIATLRVKEIAR